MARNSASVATRPSQRKGEFKVERKYTDDSNRAWSEINAWKNSLRDGQLLLNYGKDGSGKKLSPERRIQIQKSIMSDKSKIDKFLKRVRA